MAKFANVLGISLLLVSGLGKALASPTLVMPQELVDFARASGCEPINDFFDRPGMIDPPYVYGWLPGDKERSAVFWCQRPDDRVHPYRLMFRPADPRQLGCPATIEWRNPPGGLSIDKRTDVALRNFHSVTMPRRNGPAKVIRNAKVLVDYYDGLTDTFYCYEGTWFVHSAE